MRSIRLLCCALTLAAMAAVPPSSAAQATNPQAGQAPTAGQTPANPIQDATQSTSPSQQNQQQQQQQHDEAAKGRPASFDIGAAGAGQQDQELGELRLMTRYSDINGGSPQGVAPPSTTKARTTWPNLTIFSTRTCSIQRTASSF